MYNIRVYPRQASSSIRAALGRRGAEQRRVVPDNRTSPLRHERPEQQRPQVTSSSRHHHHGQNQLRHLIHWTTTRAESAINSMDVFFFYFYLFDFFLVVCCADTSVARPSAVLFAVKDVLGKITAAPTKLFSDKRCAR